MVTGVEAAGLVLGSIPLILAGLQFYAEGINVTKRYWKYKEVIKDLIRDLRRQETLYHNTIKLLLIGVVGQKDILPFLADPGGQLWKEEKVEQKLKIRLGTSYTSYFETITQLVDVASLFKQKLKLNSAGQPQFSDKNAFKEHYKRLRFSISKSDYKDIMDRLANLNEELYCMTNQTAQISAHEVTTSGKHKSSPNFQVVKEQAEGFYSALSRGWKCPCHKDHSVSLRLEPRMENEHHDNEEEETMRDPFHVLFRYDHHHPAIQCTSKPWVWEEADVRIEQKRSPMSNSVDKGVRFAKQQIPKAVKAALDTSPNLQPIKDLCAAISAFQSPQRDVCFQLLEDEIAKQQYGVLITPTKQLPLNADLWSVSSLDTHLQNPQFSQKDRFKLAVILASSVLQLHATPWLEEKWRADSIFFVDRPGTVCYDQPFVSQHFGQVNKPAVSVDSAHISCVIRNQTLYALGVALIELWYRKSIAELWDVADGPRKTGNDLLDLMTEFRTAERLSGKLYNEAGAKYSDAVRRCIRCEFDKRACSLQDAQLQQAVYQKVVAQLQEHYNFLFDVEPA